jgi:PAS domain S-box-containing protein
MRILGTYRRLIIGVDVLCLLIGVAVGLYLWLVILSPIRHLVIAVNKMTTGNLSVRLERLSRNEIGFLGQSFNHMVQKLSENREELKALYRQAEDRAASIKSYNDYIVESMHSGIMTIDLAGRVASLNPAAGKMLDLSRSQVLDQPYEQALSGLSPLAGMVSTVLHGGKNYSNATVRLTGPREIHLQVTSSFLKNPHNEQIGAVFLLADITEITKMAEQMKLRERLAAIGEMSAGLAHELRNPLNGINLLLGLFKRAGNDHHRQPGRTAADPGQFARGARPGRGTGSAGHPADQGQGRTARRPGNGCGEHRSTADAAGVSEPAAQQHGGHAPGRLLADHDPAERHLQRYYGNGR